MKPPNHESIAIEEEEFKEKNDRVVVKVTAFSNYRSRPLKGRRANKNNDHKTENSAL
jgi:hypothetical protein